LSGSGKVGGLQLRVFFAKPGRFPETEPPRKTTSAGMMGLGAGGKIVQRIYTDPHGLDTWDTSEYVTLYVQILNSVQFQSLTGVRAPPSVITAETYAKYHLPWFKLYDEEREALSQSPLLASVVPTSGRNEIEKTIPIPKNDVRTIRHEKERSQRRMKKH